jgi:hypothetical protein
MAILWLDATAPAECPDKGYQDHRQILCDKTSLLHEIQLTFSGKVTGRTEGLPGTE